MNESHPSPALKSFPRTWFHPKWQLVTWHPAGVFDDAMADQIVEFVELEENIQEAPFHRYTDLSGLTHIRLTAGHIFQIAKRRHQVAEPVKSAFWTNKIVSLSMAYVYETLMVSAAIQVRVFREREAAAEWLGVPVQSLYLVEEADQQ